MKQLNQKEKQFIDLITSGGIEGLDAIMEVYECKNRNNGSVYLNRIMKRENVIAELSKRQELLRQKKANKEMRFIELLKSFAPPVEVARRLSELIFESDKRTSESAIKTYLELSNEFPDKKIGLYKTLEEERNAVLTEATIEKLKEPEEAKIITKEEKNV